MVGCARRRNRRADAVARGDVALDAQGAVADLGGERLRAGAVAVEHGDLGAAAREFARRGCAQARGAAGDERCLSFDVHGWIRASCGAPGARRGVGDGPRAVMAGAAGGWQGRLGRTARRRARRAASARRAG